MPQNIIHISDIHFGAPGKGARDADILRGIQKLFAHIGDAECVLLVTGDIVFQGSRHLYLIAASFFDRLFKVAPFKTQNVLFCPGNHDIVTKDNRYFEDFNAFVYGIRGDSLCCYDDGSVSLVSSNDTLYVGINSAYHLNHDYGLVSIRELRKGLEQNTGDEKIKIAYFHHHLLNVFEQDHSVIRNAYELLLLLDEHNFNYLFHGHQHFSQRFPLGFSQMYSFGVRTVSFTGVATGINTYQISSEGIVYNGLVFQNDAIVNGSLGGYVSIESFNSRE